MASNEREREFLGIREVFDVAVTSAITVRGFASPAAARRYFAERGFDPYTLNIRQRWAMEFA